MGKRTSLSLKDLFKLKLVKFCKILLSSISGNIAKASKETFTKYSAFLKVASTALYL